MPKQNHTEIVCIIDRSGSMESIKTDAIGGFNNFLEAQKKLPGTASVSLVLFDNEYETPIQNADIKSVDPLTEKTFVPRGSTALLDAVGRTVNEVGTRFANMQEQDRPEKVMVCILTDGLENASREFSRSKIKEMVEHQRDKYKWGFVFLAANQDAFAEAESIGISKNMAVNFEQTGDGTRAAYDSLNMMVSEFRTKPPKKK